MKKNFLFLLSYTKFNAIQCLEEGKHRKPFTSGLTKDF